MRSHRLLPAIGLTLTLGLALAACGGSGSDDHGAKNAKVVPGAREIPVNGKSFAYDPDTIEVEAGEDVTIVLKSDDIFHDFAISKGHITQANGGDTGKGGLRIDKPGSYEFYCTVAGHRSAGMEGTIVVK